MNENSREIEFRCEQNGVSECFDLIEFFTKRKKNMRSEIENAFKFRCQDIAVPFVTFYVGDISEH